nr:hypothetical protein [Tanacetum cinerariifolium]
MVMPKAGAIQQRKETPTHRFGPRAIGSKDETSDILKKFITKIENLKDLKVKIIRTPAIGFLKPFACHVIILNTLDNLGKFEAKGDEGYFIRYSMSSKAFRVFNKRTRRVEENLHVEFLENKAIEKGVGPNWLFDINSLTKCMNYVPVDAGTNSINFLGTKDAANQEVKKDVSSLRYIVLPNWAHDALWESSLRKPHYENSTKKEDGIFLSRDKYIGDILKKFRYSYVRSSNTPMDKENPWGKDGTGKDVDLHLYRSMIGSLMYLTASRPDIMFAICAYARHQVTSKECHLHVVKRIFRYLKGHPKLGLWYPKDSPFDLVTIVAISTTEAEYVAAASCCGQVLWI